MQQDECVRWVIFGEGGRYRISDHGELESRLLPGGPGAAGRVGLVWRTMRQHFGRSDYTGAGYFRVSIRDGVKTVPRYVHRLVATHFCHNPDGLREVDHVDGNRKNNHASNLRWVSRGDNARYAAERGAFKKPKPKAQTARISEHRPEALLDAYHLLKSGKTNSEVARSFGVNQSVISNFRLGKGGFDRFYQQTGLPRLGSRHSNLRAVGK